MAEETQNQPKRRGRKPGSTNSGTRATGKRGTRKKKSAQDENVAALLKKLGSGWEDKLVEKTGQSKRYVTRMVKDMQLSNPHFAHVFDIVNSHDNIFKENFEKLKNLLGLGDNKK